MFWDEKHELFVKVENKPFLADFWKANGMGGYVRNYP